MCVVSYGEVEISDITIGELAIDDVLETTEYEVNIGRGDPRTMTPPILRTDEIDPPDGYEYEQGHEWEDPPEWISYYCHELVLKFQMPDGIGIKINSDAEKAAQDEWGQYMTMPHPYRGRWLNCRIRLIVKAQLHNSGQPFETVTPINNDNRSSFVGASAPFRTGALHFDLGAHFSQTSPKRYHIKIERELDLPLLSTSFPGGLPVNGIDDIVWRSTLRLVAMDTIDWADPINEDALGPIATIAFRLPLQKAQNTAIDKISCRVRSKLSYWNGSAWVNGYTGQPSAVLRSILQSYAASPTFRLLNARIDLDSLQNWAVWCDANGYEFNGVFDRSKTERQAIDAVCAVARASHKMIDGKFGVIWDDAQSENVTMLTPRNTWDHKVSRRMPTPLHGVKARFQRKGADLKYLHTERVVFKNGYNINSAQNVRAVDFFGVTLDAQVDKVGWYLINRHRLLLETHEYHMDLENLVIGRGDRVALSDDVSMIAVDRGRIKTVITDGGNNVTAVTVDELLAINAADFVMLVRTYKTTSPYREVFVTPTAVYTGPDEITTVTFSTSIPPTEIQPKVGDLFSWGRLSGSTFAGFGIVTAVAQERDHNAIVRVVQYQTGLYEAGTAASYQADVAIPPDIPSLEPPPPSILMAKSDEDVLKMGPDGSLIPNIALTIEYESGNYGPVAWVEVEIRKTPTDAEDPEWFTQHAVISGAPEIIDVFPVEEGMLYDARIRTRTQEHRVSEWVIEEEILVIGLSTPPPGPTGLWMESQRILSWTYPESVPLDFAGFEIRMHSGSHVSWDLARRVHKGWTTGTCFPLTMGLAGTYTIYVAALDTAGNYSTDKATLTFAFPENFVDNQQTAETDEWWGLDFRDNGWPGTRENLAPDANGDLAVQDTQLPARYTTPYSEWAAATGWEDAITIINPYTAAEGESWILEWRMGRSGEGLPDDWQPWPAEARMTGNFMIQLRVTITIGTPRGKVKQLKYSFGYPTIIEHIEHQHWGIEVPEGLLSTHGLSHATSIMGTIQSSSLGAAVVIYTHYWNDEAWARAYYFTCQLMDLNDNSVAGIVDYQLMGYRSRNGPDDPPT
jgi:hypothetical protein